MVYAITLLIDLLLASAALAAPSPRLTARLQRRQSKWNSQLMHSIESRAAKGSRQIPPVGPTYTATQAGAAYTTGAFKSVTATFTVPTLKAAFGSTSGTISAVIGLDGETCTTASLQTGVDLSITNGIISYDAWYEWYPNYAYDFSGVTISAGNSITLTVTATSKTAGTVTIKNNTTGVAVTKSLTSTYALCETNAEWLVEGGTPLANFGTIAFTSASAGLVAGGTEGPSGAGIYDIEQGGKVLTSVAVTTTSATITYIGS